LDNEEYKEICGIIIGIMKKGRIWTMRNIKLLAPQGQYLQGLCRIWTMRNIKVLFKIKVLFLQTPVGFGQ